jgi:uncharacterized membrane protein
MLDLTSLGVVHTAISLVAVGAGMFALIRDKQITGRNRVGQVYIWTTVLTCLTGFPIVRHGFGAPHITGVLALVTLFLAWQAARGKWFGRLARHVEVVSYSATFLFHMIPAFVETSTRLPVGAPLVADRNGPEVTTVTGVLFLLFVIGATLQVRRMRVLDRHQANAAALAVDATAQNG